MAKIAKPSSAHRVSRWNGPYSTPLGTTKNTGTPSDVPVRRRVHFHDQPTGRLMRVMWSDQATGEYQFHGLSASTYYVLTFDHTGEHNGETTTDIVVPTPPAP